MRAEPATVVLVDATRGRTSALHAHGGHKLRYAGLLTEAVPLANVPPPLAALLAAVG